jgi:hypothetical protein
MADTPIGSQQDVEAGVFRSVQERTVAERVSPFRLCRVDGVPRQRADQPLRRPVVKED